MVRTRFADKVLISALALGFLIQPLSLAATPGVITGNIGVTVSPTDLMQTLPITGADRLVNMSLYGVGLADALRALAKQGGFNVIVDESVTGTVSLDLKNVKIQDALETLKNYGNLAYSAEGSKLLVASADSERGKGFNRANTKIVPLRYANAKMLAELLNTSVFAPKEGLTNAANTQQKVTADFHTNSLVVVGTPRDIKIAEQHIAALDAPREMRTWRLSHANAVDLAAQLSASLFNEGIPAVIIQGSAGAGATTGAAAPGQSQIMPGSLRVQQEKIEEGEGASEQSSSGNAETTANSITLRGRVKENQILQVSPQGAILMPDTRLNSLTLLGTAEQISLAEALIPTFDRKAPQVIIEASLIEVRETANRNLGYRVGGNVGTLSVGSNNQNAYTKAIGAATNVNETVVNWLTNPVTRTQNFFVQIDAMIENRQAKMLANPTVITSHDSEAVISIVDEFIRKVEVTTSSFAPGNPAGSDVEIAEFGVVLNLLPKIGPDGSVNMRIKPTISSLQSNPIEDIFGNITNLMSKREIVAQNVRLKDGESFVLGGLIQETDADTIARVPGLSKLPILGALARNSAKSKNRSELLIVLTPHVISDESQVVRESMHNPMRPTILSNKKDVAGDGFHPVSNTSLPYASPSKLPPLEPVRVLGGNGTPAPQSMLMTAPEAPAATQNEMTIPAPEPSTSSLLAPATSATLPAKIENRPFNIQAGGPISDQQIRELINSLR